MTIVAIPNIRDLGVVPNNNMEEPEYNAASEAFTGQIPGWGADNKAVAEAGRTNALHAASAADSASSSASTANGRAEAASTSAATASTKAEEAAGSASSAAASLAAMQKLYLGNKAAHPSVDNQGAALQKGAWYTNSTNSFWYWWNGVSWIVGVGDLNVVDWATQVTNKPVLVNSVMGRSGVVTGLVEGSEVFTGKDANTVVTSVIARMDGATNGPPGFGTIELYASRHSDTAAQIAIDHLTGRMAYRSGYGIGGGAPFWKHWVMPMNASEIPTVTTGVIDCSKGSSFYLNMTGNTSLSLINAPANTTYSCELEIMHSSGSFVLPANASWSNGAAPEFMQGKAHLIYFRKTNTSPNFWLMSALPNY